VKELTGVIKLQELVEKSAFLKQEPLNIPSFLVQTWDDGEKILQSLRDQVGMLRDILKDMNLQIDEIPRLDKILEGIAQISHNFQLHHQKISRLFQLLVKISIISTRLVTPIPFVSEVSRTWGDFSGDHVNDVIKENLYFGNYETIRSFIVNLHNLFASSSVSSTSSNNFQLKDLLVSLRTVGCRLLEEFLPGVIYKDVPEIVREIGEIGTHLERSLSPHKYLTEHTFFLEEIRKARECLSRLVVSEEVREKRPLKLKGFLGMKKEGRELVELFEGLTKILPF